MHYYGDVGLIIMEIFVNMSHRGMSLPLILEWNCAIINKIHIIIEKRGATVYG